MQRLINDILIKSISIKNMLIKTILAKNINQSLILCLKVGNILCGGISLCLTLSLLLSNPLAAAPNKISDEDKNPIDIQSDSANFDEKKGLATHQGHVSVTQGSRLLSADSLEIHRNKTGKIQSITAKGDPASFEAKETAEKPPIFGQAKTLQYFPKENKIILLNAAELTQEDKTLQGSKITYHFDSQTLVSDSIENQPTTIILKNKDAE